MPILLPHMRTITRPPLDEPFELNRDSPQAEGIVAWWPTLGSRGTGKLRDYGGRGLDGTFKGPGEPAWVTDGQFGNVLSFDGSDDYIDCGTALFSTTDASQPYTVSVWMKTSSDGGIITQYYALGSPANRWGLRVLGGKLVYWKVVTLATSSQSINDGIWHCVGFVKSGSGANGVQLYIDGKPDGTGTDNNAFLSANTQIGTFGPMAVLFAGTMSDIPIHNAVLPPSVIWQMQAPQTRWELHRPLRRVWAVKLPIGWRQNVITPVLAGLGQTKGVLGTGINL